MKEATLIFPDQLFENHPAILPGRPIYLAEEFLFFRVQQFHKQRLVLLRAAMKAYAERLVEQGYQVVYIDSFQLQKRGDLFSFLSKEGIRSLHLADFSDDWLKQDLEQAAESYSWKLEWFSSPMFICSQKDIEVYFKGKKKFSMAQFYAFQRRRLNLLMEEGEPLGGKFSFDVENRKKLPKGLIPPSPYRPENDIRLDEAVAYIEQEFPKANGEAVPFLYPFTHKEAKNALLDFIQHRLRNFGDYEDAISQKEQTIFHSILSPLLNIGLLTPLQVIDSVLAAFQKRQIPLNSIEGFLRQIVGWREFMRACYVLKGKKMRSSNYFGHKANLPKGFWTGDTGIPPIDNTIKQVLKSGYCHHIERLMVLGNFLLLSECDPDAVYEWFMGNFVDAYDWVMVPNVYAMSQYADSTITTKPYISASNYLIKMSDYKKGDWAEIWDGLFWRFVLKHRELFESNPRTKVLLSLYQKNSSIIDPKVLGGEKWLRSHS